MMENRLMIQDNGLIIKSIINFLARKGLVIFIFLQFFVFTALAQKQPNILDWKTDVSLNTYLVQHMHSQYDSRRTDFEKVLTSKANTLAYIKSVKTKFKTVIGDFPKKTNLNAKITGQLDKDGYRIEKIVYESFKNHHVTANLYLPEGKGKYPAVLLFCGHEDLSKATESYQKTAILFAKNGFAVFVIDPISQSERVQLTDTAGKALTRGSTTEHTLLNLSANLVGTSVAAYELLDNVRSLDYLATRPEIDIEKIGCIGNSGGAMQAIYFAAFDDRVKVIAPCSYLASRAQTLATIGAADGCAQIPGEGFAQLEMADYLIAAAPKPILVLAGRYDFIDYNATLAAYQDLKQVYRNLGSADKLSIFTYDDGHGISKPKREKAVQWFRKCFFNDDRLIVERDFTVASNIDLFATATGKISTSYQNETNIAEQNLQLFKDKLVDRNSFAKLSITARKEKIKNLLGIVNHPSKIELQKVSKIKIGHFDVSFETSILRKETAMPIPLSIYYPKIIAKKIVIWLCDDRDKRDSIRAEFTSNVSEDLTIFTDVSGTGETTDKPEFNDPKYFSKDYRNAMLALHIGKPLVGLKTSDILNIIDFIKTDPKFTNLPIEINTIGLVGIPALHAAFLNPTISKINLYQCISSYQEVLNQPLAKDRYGIVIHNVLSYYDIPNLIDWIGKNRVTFY